MSSELVQLCATRKHVTFSHLNRGEDTEGETVNALSTIGREPRVL